MDRYGLIGSEFHADEEYLYLITSSELSSGWCKQYDQVSTSPAFKRYYENATIITT